MAVNVFLSSRVWIEPLNAFGVRHHLAALYDEVFRGHDVRMYPKRREGHLLTEGVRHLPTLLLGEINVITQGYPVLSGALACGIRRNASLIVHTWKVPGISDRRLTAQAYDVMLRCVIDRARAVVVASHNQRRQIKALGINSAVVFAPVTVDSTFWHPEPYKMDAELARFGLQRDNYVLTVGGRDRDELYGARLGRELGMMYVRATYMPASAVRWIQTELAQHGLGACSKLLEYPSDVELRALYALSLIHI